VLQPGQLVDYRVQSGDTLAALAAHFNTTMDEIMAANPQLSWNMTTLPPGMALRIPAYYLPLTGTPFQILPDSEFVYGPSAVGFDTRAAIRSRPGFLAELSSYVEKKQRPAWDVVDFVARNYSIHPRLLLTLLEHQSGALSNPFPSQEARRYPMGHQEYLSRGLYGQLVWAAERLNNGYYGWRIGELREFELADGRLTRPDPWQNAATVGLQHFFAGLLGMDDFEEAVGPQGFVRTYRRLWGMEPFAVAIDLFPANLHQPELGLPFESGVVWAYTSGPHYSWGTSLPLGALDLAPPAVLGGCAPSDAWVAAPAPGQVVRSELGTVVLDLDGDGDERTGWALFFYHVGTEGRIEAGVQVEKGDRLAHPSCEGGRATGTHVHLARKYNGEWIPAAGVLPFVMDGWVVEAGPEPYKGKMVKGSRVIEASPNATSANRILYQFP
jgi:murein DD-endopeptidase MepM/ murein hydrolase activator NlpD